MQISGVLSSSGFMMEMTMNHFKSVVSGVGSPCLLVACMLVPERRKSSDTHRVLLLCVG